MKTGCPRSDRRRFLNIVRPVNEWAFGRSALKLIHVRADIALVVVIASDVRTLGLP